MFSVSGMVHRLQSLDTNSQLYFSSNYCTQDSFTSVNQIQDIHLSCYFMVSFDVESLFTNKPLDECIDHTFANASVRDS